MQHTSFLDLNLPGYTDAVDIAKLNENFETLDEYLEDNPGGSDVEVVTTEAEIRDDPNQVVSSRLTQTLIQNAIGDIEDALSRI